MAQRAKERADGSNNNNGNNNNGSAANGNGNKDGATPAAPSSSASSGTKSQALREQPQSASGKPQTASVHSPVRDGPRKDRDDPKEQRAQPYISNRRVNAKENREWRENRDKDMTNGRSERMDRGERRRDRDREAPRAKWAWKTRLRRLSVYIMIVFYQWLVRLCFDGRIMTAKHVTGVTFVWKENRWNDF